MLQEFNYNGLLFYNAQSERGKENLAWSFSPSMENTFNATMATAIEMRNNGVDFEVRDKNVFKTSIDSRDERFSGITSMEEINNYEAVTSYLYNDELKNLMANMDAVISKASGRLNEPSKLIVGSKPIGIFSMAHASRGLIRLPEYFSPELNSVINADLIETENKKFVYNTINSSGSKKTYEIEQRQKGTTKMLLLQPEIQRKISKSGMLYTDPVKYKDHVLGFGTTVKKVFLYKSTDDLKGKGSERYVDIFINPMQSANIRKEMWIYQILPALLVAKAFEGSGFKIAIHKAPMVRSSEGNKVYKMINITTLSTYDQPINYDAIARGGGDTRILRHHDFNVFSTFFKHHFNHDSGDGIGSPVVISEAHEMLNQFAFWSVKNAEKGISGFKNQNPTSYQLVYIQSGNDQETQKERAITEFLRIMDTMGMQFQNSEQFARDAIKRYEDILQKTTQKGIELTRSNIENLRLTSPSNPNLQLSDATFSKLAKDINESRDKAIIALENIK